MRAVLRTQCGCQREIQVTFPPPPNILIPLKGEIERSIVNLQPADPANPLEAREFRRVMGVGIDPKYPVYYDEVA